MKNLKVHILYEYGVNWRPQASSSLRLLRPFSYPAIAERLEVTVGRDLGAVKPDVVLVDRLWKPDFQPEMAHALAEEVHKRGAKLIYWCDDNFLALESKLVDVRVYREGCQAFLDASDGVVVSTAPLKEEFSSKFSDPAKIVFLPSVLDERIIIKKLWRSADQRKIVIGYMGSSTHNEDLRMVIPALLEINKRYPGRLQFQIIGALNPSALAELGEINQLPIEIVLPTWLESEYPLFMLWFTGAIHWDIAIAPLTDKWFNGFKSDIKFLDYTAACVPGIFSAVPAYAGTVEREKTGLLVENQHTSWVNALGEMIEDPSKRFNLIQNATDYLYQQRILARCAGDWVNTVYTLME